MSGAIPPLPLHAFITSTGPILPLLFIKDERYCVMKYLGVSSANYYDQFKGDEIGGACNMHTADEEYKMVVAKPNIKRLRVTLR